MGIKFYPRPSSFKRAFGLLPQGKEVLAAQVTGDFTLPKDQTKPLVFIAGGIGITPFRSMIRYLLDKDERRPIVLIYAAKSSSEIAYKDIFDQATRQIGLRTIYMVDQLDTLPSENVYQGKIDTNLLVQLLPNLPSYDFYISGPRGMVASYQKSLRELKVSTRKIHTDYFSGFA